MTIGNLRKNCMGTEMKPTTSEILSSLKKLYEQAGHLSPFVGLASVRSVRQAAKFMSVYSDAGRVIELSERNTKRKKS